MKKILLLWALIMPFVFSSCDDDKDEPKNPGEELIGEWIWLEDDGRMPDPLVDDEIWHMEFPQLRCRRMGNTFWCNNRNKPLQLGTF